MPSWLFPSLRGYRSEWTISGKELALEIGSVASIHRAAPRRGIPGNPYTRISTVPGRR